MCDIYSIDLSIILKIDKKNCLELEMSRVKSKLVSARFVKNLFNLNLSSSSSLSQTFF